MRRSIREQTATLEKSPRIRLKDNILSCTCHGKLYIALKKKHPAVKNMVVATSSQENSFLHQKLQEWSEWMGRRMKLNLGTDKKKIC